MEKLTVELCKVFPYYTIVHDSDLDDDMEDIDHFVIAAFVPKLSKAELRENRERQTGNVLQHIVLLCLSSLEM